MNKYTTGGIILMVLMFSFTTAYGATFYGGEEYTLPKTESVKNDIYVGAAVTTISGNVLGDSLIGGGEVTILGETGGNLLTVGGTVISSGGVGGDALVAGGDVKILGFVRDDLRIVGGNVAVSNAVGGDVVALGGVVHLVSGATVAGDVVLFGDIITIDGTINGNVYAKGRELRINGTVRGTIDAEAKEKFIIGDRAVLTGGGTYSSKTEAEISETAKIQKELLFEKIIFTDKTPIRSFFKAGMMVFGSMLLLMALLAVYFSREGVKKLVSQTISLFWKNAGIGFIALVMFPILVIVLLFTIIGLPLGLLIGFGYITTLIATKLLISVVIGALAIKLATRSDDYRFDWLTAVVGVITLLALLLVPVIGYVIVFVVFLATFGSMLQIVRERLWS